MMQNVYKVTFTENKNISYIYIMKSFEFTTSHAMCVLVILLTFVIFFQPFNMVHTLLGRLTLLFTLILATSYNVMYGLTCAVLIIVLREYYDRYEGFEDAKIKHNVKTTDNINNIQANESGATSSHSTIPVDEQENENTKKSSDSMNQTKKTELETAMKAKDSKQIPVSATAPSSNNVSSSEASVTNAAAKEGFANMYGPNYSIF